VADRDPAPVFPFDRPPLRYRRGMPWYADKSPAALRADPYEQYDPMVLRQTALHLVADWWPTYPFQEVLDWCLARLPATPAMGNALEVGCGVGRFIGEVARARPEWSCVGLDYSHQLLRQAGRYWCGDGPIEIDGRDRGFTVARLTGFRLPNVQFALADAADLPLRSGSMDWIIAAFVLDRLADPAAALAEWARVLRPGGHLLLTLPYNFQRAELWSHWYPPDKLAQWLDRNNWRIAEQRRFEIIEPLDRHGNALHWHADAFLLRHP
jgi:SAM-dependent methyltransferase